MSTKWRWTTTLRSERHASIKKGHTHFIKQVQGIFMLPICRSKAAHRVQSTCCAHHPSYCTSIISWTGQIECNLYPILQIGNVITQCLLQSIRGDNKRPVAFMYLSSLNLPQEPQAPAPPPGHPVWPHDKLLNRSTEIQGAHEHLRRRVMLP